MKEEEQPTLNEQQLMLLEHAIVGHFLKRGILCKSTMADYLYLITKHLDPTPSAPAPVKIYNALDNKGEAS